jgi:hypothetical protein
VSSYFNRLPHSYAYQQSNTTASTSMVPLHNPIKMLLWGDSSYQIQIFGYVQLNAAGNTIVQGLMDGVGASPVQSSYLPVANAQCPIATGMAQLGPAGLHTFQLGGYVSASTGTFVATTYGTVMG